MAQQLTNEETIALLNERAKERGDAFKVKVSRLRGAGMMPELVLVADSVSVGQIANPENWLPKLCGGGPSYLVHCYHMSDPTNPVGQRLTYNIGGAIKNVADLTALQDQSYDGPRLIVFPTLERSQPQQTYIPGPAVPVLSTPHTLMPGVVPPGPGFSAQDAALQRDREAIVSERAALAAAQREMQAQAHKAEMETMRRENDARLREIEARITATKADHTSKPGELITALAVAFGPILQTMITSQNESRLAMLKMQGEQAAQHQALLTRLLEKPGTDPQLKEAQDRLFSVLEKQLTAEPPNQKMFGAVADAMQSVMTMTTQAVAMVTDMQQGEREPVGMLVVKELVKGINAIAQGVTSAAKPKRLALPPQAALPAQQQQQSQAFNGAPQQHQGNPNIVAEIEGAIRVMQNPAHVAAYFVQALRDPFMQEALRAAGGDPIALFQARLATWVTEKPEHGQYVLALSNELTAQLTAAGVQFVPDPPAQAAQPEDEEGEEEGEYEEDEGEEADA